MYIQALSGDAGFLERLTRANFSGTVHSTFERTINLKCSENGELYTIGNHQLDNAPNTLIIDVKGFSELGLPVNTPVITEDGTLVIGSDLRIWIQQAAKWEGVLPSYPCDIEAVEVLRRNVAFTKNYVDEYGKTGGMKMSSQPASPFEKEMSRMLIQRADMLSDDLANKRIESATQHAISLIGLGPGLTPSGDDFLVGLCSVYKMQNISSCLSCPFFDEIVRSSQVLTNEISAITLKKAAHGQVRESLNDLLSCMISGSLEELVPALDKIIRIGSSSGTDILLGILCGLERNLEAGGNVCLPKS
ncbi:hypothetical protein BBR47_45130 [Brevibacillus brevis NBRC 100599]|uniref:DUF2877 domain-containing protein n=1 Tax=Brevibacillus brevis (strain 47 / JCM 6285 / NBRC 100599) TaxID=358681 RepID=C0ZJB5_BREBN|nr:DUF2877 domain-containing protein [Brevibacillus brevis]BAH45490.1 hypothetical protein BBR47_45130 [Brevibacillus brevis NBRC 100599]